MTTLNIVIQSLEDAKNGVPILKNSPPATEYIPLEDATLGILEGGMHYGKTSIMILSKDAAGKVYYLETSAELFMLAAAAVQGARERFGDV